jgi:hypothetical protein
MASSKEGAAHSTLETFFMGTNGLSYDFDPEEIQGVHVERHVSGDWRCMRQAGGDDRQRATSS